tara:strand:+ start:155278 stop:156291 length:1014 start_codon:yes stop_codon:yes gene_type:complete
VNSFHSIETPTHSPGAIAMIRVVHPDPAAIGLVSPEIGSVRLAKLFEIDEGVIVRWDADSIVLMPHGGVAIVRAISQRLAELGVPIGHEPDPRAIYPEAESEIEAWMLLAIAQAASPGGIDVLLDQPARWKKSGIECITDADECIETSDAASLNRFITPPIVAAVGRANVGKSTLINALVGEQVALVADMAGTTRDHVGVLVDLGGLVVRWMDTPGIDERIEGGEEIELATRVIGQADLIVQCIDADGDLGTLDPRLIAAIAPGVPVVRVGTRADLGEHACSVDVRVSLAQAARSQNIEALVSTLKETLVPQSAIDDPRPWRFWDGLSVDATTTAPR